MTTINISLPEKQARMIDVLIQTYGFASRSEFFRTVLRKILGDRHILKNTVTYPFISPPLKSRKKIMAEFAKTKKHSSAFLADLEEGLKNSDYFQE